MLAEVAEISELLEATAKLIERTRNKKNQLACEQFACLETKISRCLTRGDCEVFVTNGTLRVCWTEIIWWRRSPCKETAGNDAEANLLEDILQQLQFKQKSHRANTLPRYCRSSPTMLWKLWKETRFQSSNVIRSQL